MLNTADFYQYLESKGVEFSTGIPDSLLKHFCAYVSDHSNDIIAANEGACIGLATGYHLATNKIPLVYMQNSGFGNIVNPLISLTDPEVYSIPMLLMIGWRGEPDKKDEPQHIKMGRINEAMLKVLEVPYCILSEDIKEAQQQVDVAFRYMNQEKAPFALLVRKDTFSAYKMKPTEQPILELSRESAIQILLESINRDKDHVVSTTGKTSREVFENRKKRNEDHDSDFLTVGCMGHVSQIALGIALNKKDKRIICIDGDGSLIMHMGSLAIVGDLGPTNYRHILINNGCHDSVGGQPTVGFSIDFQAIALACGYVRTYEVDTESSLRNIIPQFLSEDGPSLLEIKVAKGSRSNLGRPTISPKMIKKAFMNKLNS